MITESRARKRAGPWRLMGWLSATALIAAMAALPMGGATAQPEQSSPEFVNAVAGSSLAQVRVDWSGWVLTSRRIELGQHDGSIEYFPAGFASNEMNVSTSCSGFVASSTGDVVTAGHCVDGQSFDGGKGAIIDAFVAQDTHVDGDPLTPAEQASEASLLRAWAEVEGPDSGSPPDRTVKVTVPSLSGKAQPANVVDVQSFTNGDVALLNVTGLNAPVIPVAKAAPESGTNIVAAGFAGNVNDVVDANTAPSYNPGSVSGTRTVNGTPFTQISARTSFGMSGGPVLDMQGQVAGTISWGPDTSVDFMTAVSSVQSILKSNGVDNSLGEADQAFRQGLTYYYESRYHDAVAQFDKALALQPGWKMITGYKQKAIANYPNDVNPPGLPIWAWVAIGAGALLLVGAGVLGVFLMRRRRARPSAGAPAAPPVAVPPQPGMQTGPSAQTIPSPPASEMPPPATTAPLTQTPGGTTAPGQDHVFCSNCGARHDPAAHYCDKCGQPLPAAMPAEHGTG